MASYTLAPLQWFSSGLLTLTLDGQPATGITLKLSLTMRKKRDAAQEPLDWLLESRHPDALGIHDDLLSLKPGDGINQLTIRPVPTPPVGAVVEVTLSQPSTGEPLLQRSVRIF